MLSEDGTVTKSLRDFLGSDRIATKNGNKQACIPPSAPSQGDCSFFGAFFPGYFGDIPPCPSSVPALLEPDTSLIDKTDEKVPVFTLSSSVSPMKFANGKCPDGVCVSPGPTYNGPPIDRDVLPSPLRGCVDWPMNSDWLEFAFAPVVS